MLSSRCNTSATLVGGIVTNLSSVRPPPQPVRRYGHPPRQRELRNCLPALRHTPGLPHHEHLAAARRPNAVLPVLQSSVRPIERETRRTRRVISYSAQPRGAHARTVLRHASRSLG